jgi:hypothetical protein
MLRIAVIAACFLAVALCFIGYHLSLPLPSAPSDMAEFNILRESEVTADSQALAAFADAIRPYIERGTPVPESLFEAHYTDIGPQRMLDVLDQSPTCHVEAHNLGRVVFRHAGDLASSLAICTTQCSEGCIHGALMELFHAPDIASDPSLASMTPDIASQMAQTCKNPTLLRFMSTPNCYHAIGHVLDALAENDIPTAVGLCDFVFASTSPAAQYFCATGAYMQQDLVIPTTGLDAKGEVALCASNKYPAACYRFQLYRIFDSARGYIAANEFCDTLSGAQRLGCFNGIGSDWFRLIQHEPASLDAVCGTGTDEDKRMCLEGVLQLLNVYYPGKAMEACDLYAGSSTLCSNAAQHRNFDLGRDFSLYVAE